MAHAIDEPGADGEALFIVLAILFAGPMLIYDYYQNVNFSFFYVPFFPIALIWYWADPTAWNPAQLHKYTYDIWEPVILNQIPWEDFWLKVQLHFLYYPYLLELMTEESAKDAVVGLMFLRNFEDVLLLLSGLVSLTVFFPFELLYLTLATIVFFGSLVNWTIEEYDPAYRHIEEKEELGWRDELIMQMEQERAEA